MTEDAVQRRRGCRRAFLRAGARVRWRRESAVDATGEVEWEVDHAASGGRSAAGRYRGFLTGPQRGETAEGFGPGLPA